MKIFRLVQLISILSLFVIPQAPAQESRLEWSEFKRAFFNPRISSAKAIQNFAKRYPEILILTGSVHGSPDLGTGQKDSFRLSEQIFGVAHQEFDRTALAVLTIKWIQNNSYEEFVSVQKQSKLTRESFGQLRKSQAKILTDDEALNAMLVFMAIHDLGKVKAFAEEISRREGQEILDHDRIFLIAADKYPELLPSFQALSPRYQALILEGLRSEFNFGQFLQGENVAFNLSGFQKLSPEVQDFLLLHLVYDIAGVAGHVDTRGSLVMTEPTFQTFFLGIEALIGLRKNQTVYQVYERYLEFQSQRIEIRSDQNWLALTRVCMMLRLTDPQAAQTVVKGFYSLQSETQGILLEELNRMGRDTDSPAILLYYSPAFLSNLARTFTPEEGVSKGLNLLADLFSILRRALKRQPASSPVFVTDIAEVAAAAKDRKAFEDLAVRDLRLERISRDEGKIRIRKK